jgi:hypothetical protein
MLYDAGDAKRSDRTIMPTPIVANHMKVAPRENAGRSDCSTSQQETQSCG